MENVCDNTTTGTKEKCNDHHQLTCTVDSISSIARLARTGETPLSVGALCILMTVVQVIPLTFIDVYTVEQKQVMILLNFPKTDITYHCSLTHFHLVCSLSHSHKGNYQWCYYTLVHILHCCWCTHPHLEKGSKGKIFIQACNISYNAHAH